MKQNIFFFFAFFALCGLCVCTGNIPFTIWNFAFSMYYLVKIVNELED